MLVLTDWLLCAHQFYSQCWPIEILVIFVPPNFFTEDKGDNLYEVKGDSLTEGETFGVYLVHEWTLKFGQLESFFLVCCRGAKNRIAVVINGIAISKNLIAISQNGNAVFANGNATFSCLLDYLFFAPFHHLSWQLRFGWFIACDRYFFLPSSFCSKGKTETLVHFSSKEFVTYSSFLYLCIGFGGKIPNRRCISLLFRTYRKDLGNLFWNSSI